MKSKFLFPTWGSWVGYLLAIPGLILGYLNVINNYRIPGFVLRIRAQDRLFAPAFENFTNELAIFLVVVGFLLIAFSKSKQEDELNAKLRLNALYWSVMTYYLFYFIWLCLSTVVEVPFLGEHASELNLFTPLVIFIGRFYYLKYIKRENYQVGDPKFLPYSPFKWFGRVVALFCLVAMVGMLITDSTRNWSDTTFNFVYLGLIVGLLFWAFSQNKQEDEMTMQQRLESLQLAVYINYGVILLATLLLYSLSFLFFLKFAEFSLLLYFVLRMEYVNYKNNRLLNIMDGGMSYEK